MRALLNITLTAMLLLSAGDHAAAEAGLERIEAPTGERSLAPRLVETGEGSAILSWLDVIDDGHRLMLSEFNGERFGPAHEVARGSDFFANWADTPGVGITDDGRWLAHWLVRSGRGTYAYDVVMAWSEDGGTRWSAPFSPHDDGTLTEHGFVSTFPVPGRASALGAVWLDGRETRPAAKDRIDDPPGHHDHGEGAMTLRTATVDRSGRVLDAHQLDDRVCDCCATATARTREGVIVVYRDRSEDEVRDIWRVRLTEAGWSEPAVVHPDGWQIAACPVNGPDVIARDRQVVVAWFTMANGQPRVQLATSSDGGDTFSEPQVFDADIALGRVDLSWLDEGFVLSWMSQTGSTARWRLARFDDDGTLVGESDLGALDQGRISGVPQVLSGNDDALWVAWTESRGEPGRPRVQFGRVRLTSLSATADSVIR